jgi:hypothetical protein
MKSMAFLEHVAHDRKAAVYAAGHDGKVRKFAYHEELGECRETFSRLLQDVQKGEIGVILTPNAASLTIETSPGWLETFILAIKQHEVLIGDHGHDLVYDLRDEEDEAQFRQLYPQGEYEKVRYAPRPLVDAIAQSPFAAATLEKGENWFLVTRMEDKNPDAPIYILSSGPKGKGVDMLGVGPWEKILEALAPYGITEQGGWCPVYPEQKDWLRRTQQQEDAMARQTTAAMEPHWSSLPTNAQQLNVILPGSREARSKQGRKRRRRNT